MIGAALVDTDVLSFLFKGDTRAAKYEPHVAGRLIVVSFMTVAELERWALQRNWGEAKRVIMAERLRQFVLPPISRELCQRWAQVTDGARRNGFSVSCADAWIAATAIFLNIPLITNNRRDFELIDRLQLITHAPE